MEQAEARLEANARLAEAMGMIRPPARRRVEPCTHRRLKARAKAKAKANSAKAAAAPSRAKAPLEMARARFPLLKIGLALPLALGLAIGLAAAQVFIGPALPDLVPPLSLGCRQPRLLCGQERLSKPSVIRCGPHGPVQFGHWPEDFPRSAQCAWKYI